MAPWPVAVPVSAGCILPCKAGAAHLACDEGLNGRAASLHQLHGTWPHTGDNASRQASRLMLSTVSEFRAAPTRCTADAPDGAWQAETHSTSQCPACACLVHRDCAAKRCGPTYALKRLHRRLQALPALRAVPQLAGAQRHALVRGLQQRSEGGRGRVKPTRCDHQSSSHWLTRLACIHRYTCVAPVSCSGVLAVAGRQTAHTHAAMIITTGMACSHAHACARMHPQHAPAAAGR